MANIDLKIWNAANDDFTTKSEDHDDISYEIGNPAKILVKLDKDQWLKTRLMLTTMGGKVAMAYFDYKIKGPGTLYLKDAAYNVLNVFNTAGTLGGVKSFPKNDVIAYFQSTSVFSTYDRLVIG